MITRLDSVSARKISAGQVITDLSSVVKELLENSLDAGAQCVKVRLYRFGLDKIVVDDNGSGIPMPGVVEPASGALLEGSTTPLLRNRATTKRCNRKESALTSSVSVGSPAGAEEDAPLGFRGEALHSLAQVSDVVVETMHATYAPHTVRIGYDSESHAVQLAVIGSRQGMGTTVSVEGLFKNLPVRLKEFAKNQRRQLLNATNLLRQFAVSHPKLRLLVTHQEGAQSALVTLVSLTGSYDLQRSVTEAYGALCLSHMTRVEWRCSFGDVEGFVSKVDGGGRMSSDRQVFSLDGRIVDLPRLAAAISDAFSQCLPNAHQRQSVAFFLRIRMRAIVDYDVNLAPNKRTVLMGSEEKLAEEMHRVALEEFQAASEGIEIQRQDQRPRAQLNSPRGSAGAADASKAVLKAVSTSAFTQYTYRSQGGGGGAGVGSSGRGAVAVSDDTPQKPTLSLRKLDSVLYSLDGEESDADIGGAHHLDSDSLRSTSDSQSECEGRSEEGGAASNAAWAAENAIRHAEDSKEGVGNAIIGSIASQETGLMPDTSSTGSGINCADTHDECMNDLGRPSQRRRREEAGGEVKGTGQPSESLVLLSDAGNQKREHGPQAALAFPSWERLSADDYTQCCRQYLGEYDSTADTDSSSPTKGQFSGLLDQTGKELTAFFHKRSFRDMAVLGQFNHGFIITSLGDDLFVIDQHASDEKFNYERLMRGYAATPQPLVRSIPVPMDSEEVELAVAHAPDLLRHGFSVSRGEDPTKLLVSSVPVLPYDVVSASDVQELVQQLVRYGTITRQLRAVWHSMATKACRSSIMIGTALPAATMRAIVERLSELDQPWTCPHGRPTLRHLGNKNTFRLEHP